MANIQNLLAKRERKNKNNFIKDIEKIKFLREMCKEEKPYFLAFAETWLNDRMKPNAPSSKAGTGGIGSEQHPTVEPRYKPSPKQEVVASYSTLCITQQRTEACEPFVQSRKWWPVPPIDFLRRKPNRKQELIFQTFDL